MYTCSLDQTHFNLTNTSSLTLQEKRTPHAIGHPPPPPPPPPPLYEALHNIYGVLEYIITTVSVLSPFNALEGQTSQLSLLRSFLSLQCLHFSLQCFHFSLHMAFFSLFSFCNNCSFDCIEHPQHISLQDCRSHSKNSLISLHDDF